MIALKKNPKPQNAGRIQEALKGKLRMYFEKISLGLEEEQELGMQLG
jgi:hypothetical protein